MKFLSTNIALAVCLSFASANAQTDTPDWTLSTSGSWSEIDSSDRDAVSLSVSLSRQIGDNTMGGSIGTSNGSDALFDQVEVTDRSSVFGSVWFAFPVGEAYVDLSASFGRDDYNGQVIIEESRFGLLEGSGVNLSSEVDSFAVSAAISRTFVSSDWDIIPNASLGWSQSESTIATTAVDESLAPTAVSEEQAGLTGSAGMGVGYVATDAVYMFADILGLYTENGASTGITSASRNGGLRASSRQELDEAAWAELSLGASIYATETVTVSFVGGTTTGRDEEEIFATTSISVGF